MKLPPARWSPAAITELLTVEKQCKRIFHGNEWMKEHNYAFQNADERPRLESRTQNICFVISISAQFILKLMVKITSIFGSYKFLRIACHDIFSLSNKLLCKLELSPVLRSRRANVYLLVGLTPGRVKRSWTEIQSPSNHRAHLKDSYVS